VGVNGKMGGCRYSIAGVAALQVKAAGKHRDPDAVIGPFLLAVFAITSNMMVS